MYIKMSVKTRGGADDFSQCEHPVSTPFVTMAYQMTVKLEFF